MNRAVTIRRTFGIDVGHRLLRHEGKCRHVHGHRYTIEVELSASSLDAVGRVVDFSVVKSTIGGWLDEEWDHGFLAEKGDPIIEWLTANGMKHRVLDVPPTAEHLVFLLGTTLPRVLRAAGVSVEIVSVKLWETPNCSAEWRAP